MTTTVLSIAHTAVSRDAGRLRYEPLAARPDLDVHLVVPDRWRQFGRVSRADPPENRGMTVHVTRVRWPSAGPASWYLHHYPELPRLIRELRPDVIHLWEEPWSLVASHAVHLRRKLRPGAAIVLEVDQNISKRLPFPFERMRRRVLRQTQHVLARSHDAVNVVRSAGYGGPCGLIGYGVNRAVFRPLDRQACRTALGMSGFAIGYVGRLVPEKGLDDLLDAMARMMSVAALHIMGEGPHRQALVAHARALGLADRVHFHRWGDPGHVARFFSAVDVAALLTHTTASVREQFGRVIIEAHACGVPVIGSTCGAIPDVIGDGGWVVAERDPGALSICLDRLAAEPALLELAGSRGLQQIRKQYTNEIVARTLADTWRVAHSTHVERGGMEN